MLRSLSMPILLALGTLVVGLTFAAADDFAYGPAYENWPQMEYGPNYRNWPQINYGPSYENWPQMEYGPAYEDWPQMDYGPSYKNWPDANYRNSYRGCRPAYSNCNRNYRPVSAYRPAN